MAQTMVDDVGIGCAAKGTRCGSNLSAAKYESGCGNDRKLHVSASNVPKWQDRAGSCGGNPDGMWAASPVWGAREWVAGWLRMCVGKLTIESRSTGQTAARRCADVLVTTDEMRSGLGGGTSARMVALAAALQQRAGLAVALVEEVTEVAEMADRARQASVNL